MTGTPILKEEKVATRQVSKGLSVKNKNKMCSILGFLLYLKENGKIDETEAKRLMEELPLYSISRIQTEFLEQDAFDLKKVEVELWKPMVVENKLNKKAEKKEKKEKPKKERKVKKTTDDENVDVDADADENVETKKRGRKAKKQIIEFNNTTTGTVTCDSEGSSDQLEELLNEMLETSDEEKELKEEQELKEVNESDLEAVLRELEEGELEEENMVVPVVVPVPIVPPPTKKEKATGGKGKNKKDKKEEEPKEEEPKEEEKKVEDKKVTKKDNKKKVKISE